MRWSTGGHHGYSRATTQHRNLACCTWTRTRRRPDKEEVPGSSPGTPNHLRAIKHHVPALQSVGLATWIDVQATLTPDAAGPVSSSVGLKNALEAGRQSSHTAAAPATPRRTARRRCSTATSRRTPQGCPVAADGLAAASPGRTAPWTDRAQLPALAIRLRHPQPPGNPDQAEDYPQRDDDRLVWGAVRLWPRNCPRAAALMSTMIRASPMISCTAPMAAPAYMSLAAVSTDKARGAAAAR